MDRPEEFPHIRTGCETNASAALREKGPEDGGAAHKECEEDADAVCREESQKDRDVIQQGGQVGEDTAFREEGRDAPLKEGQTGWSVACQEEGEEDRDVTEQEGQVDRSTAPYEEGQENADAPHGEGQTGWGVACQEEGQEDRDVTEQGHVVGEAAHEERRCDTAGEKKAKADHDAIHQGECPEECQEGCQTDRDAVFQEECEEDGGGAYCEGFQKNGNAGHEDEGQVGVESTHAKDVFVDWNEAHSEGVQKDGDTARQEGGHEGGDAIFRLEQGERDRYAEYDQEDCLASRDSSHREESLDEGDATLQEENAAYAGESPQVTRRKRRQPMVNWKRVPWETDIANRQALPDHVTIPNLPTNQERRISVADRGEGAESSDDEGVGEEIKEINRKLKEHEAKLEEFYYTKEKNDREMESIIENTEKVHDTLMNLRVAKRKLEAERDRLEAELHATKMDVKCAEASVNMEAVGYEELIERFEGLQTTIAAQKEACPDSFSLLLQLEEELLKDLDSSSCSDDSAVSEKSPLPSMPEDENNCEESPEKRVVQILDG